MERAGQAEFPTEDLRVGRTSRKLSIDCRQRRFCVPDCQTIAVRHHDLTERVTVARGAAIREAHLLRRGSGRRAVRRDTTDEHFHSVVVAGRCTEFEALLDQYAPAHRWDTPTVSGLHVALGGHGRVNLA